MTMVLRPDLEHVEILGRGITVWNRWRKDNPDIIPNLRSLNRMIDDVVLDNYAGADFHRADLGNVWLPGANLAGADLAHANLTGAELAGANLSQAELRLAYFSGRRMGVLSVEGRGGAGLRGTNLAGAHLGWTAFHDIDLSSTEGLYEVIHHGPSYISVGTLYQSEGKIPKPFLRGSGVPETMIDYVSPQAIDIHSCFISYSHDDRTFARWLHDELQCLGVRCWLDEHELLPGDDLYIAIDRGIRLWDKLLLCCSRSSLTSWWVDTEIDIAFEKERQLLQESSLSQAGILIPLDIDGYLFSSECKSGKAARIRSRFSATFAGWTPENAFTYRDRLQGVYGALCHKRFSLTRMDSAINPASAPDGWRHR